MKREKRIIIFYIFDLFFFISCGEKIKQNQSHSDFNKNIPAQIVFDTLKHDFGNIVSGEQVSYSFDFKNRGGTPLFINEVKTECGCTVTQFSREPVKPGNSGTIHVIFDSQGYSGNVFKSMKVYSNASKEQTELEIAAFVKVTEIIEN